MGPARRRGQKPIYNSSQTLKTYTANQNKGVMCNYHHCAGGKGPHSFTSHTVESINVYVIKKKNAFK